MTARGFTLIELLVVVLIIGILAAIALTQYQKAVEKSRWAKLQPLVNTLANAQRAYYLEHGRYTKYLPDLEVGFSDWTQVTVNGMGPVVPFYKTPSGEYCTGQNGQAVVCYLDGPGVITQDNGSISFTSAIGYGVIYTWQGSAGDVYNGRYCVTLGQDHSFCRKVSGRSSNIPYWGYFYKLP